MKKQEDEEEKKTPTAIHTMYIDRECNLIRTVPNQRCLAFKYFNFKFCMRVIKICCHFLLFDRVVFHYFI